MVRSPISAYKINNKGYQPFELNVNLTYQVFRYKKFSLFLRHVNHSLDIVTGGFDGFDKFVRGHLSFDRGGAVGQVDGN